MLRLKLNHVSKRDHRQKQFVSPDKLANKCSESVCVHLFVHSGGETGLFQTILANAMAADDPVPLVTSSPEAMVLTIEDKQVLGFHKEGFQWPVPS